jgi:hypothetical protein
LIPFSRPSLLPLLLLYPCSGSISSRNIILSLSVFLNSVQPSGHSSLCNFLRKKLDWNEAVKDQEISRAGVKGQRTRAWSPGTMWDPGIRAPAQPPTYSSPAICLPTGTQSPRIPFVRLSASPPRHLYHTHPSAHLPSCSMWDRSPTLTSDAKLSSVLSSLFPIFWSLLGKFRLFHLLFLCQHRRAALEFIAHVEDLSQSTFKLYYTTSCIVRTLQSSILCFCPPNYCDSVVMSFICPCYKPHATLHWFLH